MQPTHPEAVPEPPRASGDVPDSNWRSLLAGAVFVIGITALFSYLMARNDTGANPRPAFLVAFVDNFDRPSNESSLGSNSVASWTSDAGVWGIDAGVALLHEPVQLGDSLATIALGTRNQSMSARVAGLAQCGLVLRYEDAFNFVALIRVHAFAVWNVVEMRDGQETILGKVPDLDANDVGVTLTATDRVVSASVGLNTITLAGPTGPSGSRVGLIARGEGAEQCSWDDVTAQRAN